MSHARKIIRSTIATILKATPNTWSQVVESRIQSTRQVWPYLMVFADGETSAATTINTPTIYDRSMTLSIVGLLRLPGSGDTQTIEDKMDEVASEIETMLTYATVHAVVTKIQTIEIVSTKMDVILEEDGIDHAEINQTWRITYSTLEGLPEALI